MFPGCSLLRAIQMMPTHRTLAVPCLAMLMAGAPAVFGTDWTFTMVNYTPANADCFTCASPTTTVIGATMGLCLQFTAGCPAVGGGEDNAGACIGGDCSTDDDTGFGSDMPVIPQPPPTPTPTAGPTQGTQSPTATGGTRPPTPAPVTSSPATAAPTPPPPGICGVSDSCNCENARLSPGSSSITVNVTCLGGGFTGANSTETQLLANVTAGECSLKFESSVNITNATGTFLVPVTICYGNGNPSQNDDDEEEECKNNTGVIVIIIICVLLLLVVIGIGIYYIVHTTNAHSVSRAPPARPPARPPSILR